MEGDLCGSHHIQAAIYIFICEGTEGFHHGLLIGFCVVGLIHHVIACIQDGIHIPVFLPAAGTEISFVVRSHIAEGMPIFFRVDEDGIILGGVKIQNRLQYLIGYLDHFESTVHTGLIFAGHDGHRIADIANSLIKNQPIVRTWLWIRLASEGKPFIWNILPGKNAFDPGNLLCCRGIDIGDPRMGIGTPEYFYNQAVRRCQIIRINRFAGDKSLWRLFFRTGVFTNFIADTSFFFLER